MGSLEFDELPRPSRVRSCSPQARVRQRRRLRLGTRSSGSGLLGLDCEVSVPLTGRVDFERDLVIVASAISARVHAALTPDHFGEGAGAGLGFLVSAVLLAGLVVALTRDASPPVLAATILHPRGPSLAYALGSRPESRF